MKTLELLAGLLAAALIAGPLTAGAFHLGAQDKQAIESTRYP